MYNANLKVRREKAPPLWFHRQSPWTFPTIPSLDTSASLVAEFPLISVFWMKILKNFVIVQMHHVSKSWLWTTNLDEWLMHNEDLPQHNRGRSHSCETRTWAPRRNDGRQQCQPSGRLWREPWQHVHAGYPVLEEQRGAIWERNDTENSLRHCGSWRIDSVHRPVKSPAVSCLEKQIK